VVEVIVPQEPAGMATTGYCINSIQLNNGDASAAIGIDLGNATTIVSFAKAPAKPTPDTDKADNSNSNATEQVSNGSDANKVTPRVKPTPAPVLNIVDEALEDAIETVAPAIASIAPDTAAAPAKTAPAKSGDRLGKFLKTGMW
jgi:hypothetical protein